MACLTAGDCEPGVCVNDAKTGGERCEAGECVANAMTPCAPYACNAAGDNCLSDCETNGVNDCIDDFLCSQDDICVSSFYNGHPCGMGQCTSGFCVDGVCCDSACDDGCDQCVESTTGLPDGMCGLVAAFTDPDTECTLPLGCDDVGMCAACGFTVTAPGHPTECPPQCDSCDHQEPKVCRITCDDTDNMTTCDGLTVDCPAGWNCVVDCVNDHACRNATINCPDDHRCDVGCAALNHSCQNLTLSCSLNGTCALDCQGGNACDGANAQCQNNRCTGTCPAGGDAPSFVDNTAACEIGCP